MVLTIIHGMIYFVDKCKIINIVPTILSLLYSLPNEYEIVLKVWRSEIGFNTIFKNLKVLLRSLLNIYVFIIVLLITIYI